MQAGRHNSPQRGQPGFTLIEVVIAISILALLTVVIAVSWRIGANAQARVDAEILRSRSGEAALEMMERQIASAVALHDPNEKTRRAAYFHGDAGRVRFITRYTMGSRSRAGLAVVEYQVERGESGDRIVSSEWPVRAQSDLQGNAGPAGALVDRELPLIADGVSYNFAYLVVEQGTRAKQRSAAWNGEDGLLPAGIVLQARNRQDDQSSDEWTFALHARDVVKEPPTLQSGFR